MWSALREFYKKYWLGFLFWLNETYLGGRAHAGGWVRSAQITRWIVNAIMIITILSVMGFSTIFSGGLALPAWATLILWLGMSINMAALPIGSASNTVKIQVYYDFEWRLRLKNNEKGLINEEPPHGLLTSHAAQRNMLLKRYAHDVNGATGTVLSFLLTLASCLTFFGITTLFSIATAAWFFICSRFSGAFSATGASYTYKNRLDVHTQNINKQIDEYYDHSELNTPDVHENITLTIDKVFSQYLFTENKYYKWLKFECYCAVERAVKEGISTDQMLQTIQQVLESTCDTKGDTKTISRDKLHHFLKQEDAGAPALSVLDALPYVQEKLYQMLKCTKGTIAEVPFIAALRQQMAPCQNGYREAFITYFKSSWLSLHKDFYGLQACENSFAIKLEAYLEKRGSIFHFNKEVLKEKEEWAIETSHGKQLLASHHIKKLAELFAQQCIEQEKIIKQPTSESVAEKTAKEHALEIWDAVFPKNEGEYEYDDHKPIFHKVMSNVLRFVIAKIEAELQKPKKEQSLNTLKQTLKNNLETIVKKATQDSSFRKRLRELFPYYFSTLPFKSFNVDRLNVEPSQSCRTVEMTQASKVYTALVCC